jgi:hypothetical protein
MIALTPCAANKSVYEHARTQIFIFRERRG